MNKETIIEEAFDRLMTADDLHDEGKLGYEDLKKIETEVYNAINTYEDFILENTKYAAQYSNIKRAVKASTTRPSADSHSELKELTELIDETTALTTTLNEISRIVRLAERTLEKNNVFIEFQHQVDIRDNIHIAWKRYKNSRKFRIFLIIDDIEKPLQELKVDAKLEYSHYLYPFLKEFKKYIKGKQKTAIEMLKKMKEGNNG